MVLLILLNCHHFKSKSAQKGGAITMPIHGEIRKTYECEHLVMNEKPKNKKSMNNKLNNKEKVIELSRLETYIVKEIYCVKCEEWQEADSRYFITDIFCPNCCTDWK